MNRTIIKNSSKEVVVKFDGAGGATGINLSELCSADQVLGATGASGATGPVVNISAYVSTGYLGANMRVTRNGTTVISCAPENAPAIQFNQLGFTDNVNNNKDIVIEYPGASGAIVQTYLVLHKQDGFYSKVEYEKYGAYDDETKVGALDTSGSPDYTG